MKAKIGLQLYTLREACEKDFFATLEQVAKLGYEGVEFAGFYGVKAEVLKEKLDAINLTAISCHIPIERLENDLDSVIAYNKIIGNSRIVCPWSEWKEVDGFNKIVSILNQAAIRLKEAGMTLFYHNHNHEFNLIKDRYALDVLLSETKENGMCAELDTYWVQYAGVDPIMYMEKYHDRCGLIHLKDMIKKEDDYITAAIGDGIMPIDAIIAKADEIGIPWVIVENDFPKPDGISNITMSMCYLRNK